MADSARGVVVLGAHRSGTSAVTRLINTLGVPLCRDDDLVPAGVGNVAGHWESRSLTRRNEQLLHFLGSAWDCPPPVEANVGAELLAEVRRGPARSAFIRSFPTDRWVWKDPRLSVLLPFWREVVPGPMVAVLVLRRPEEVAASLVERNQLTPTHGLAIWERYLRHALLAAAGLPTLALEHAAVMAAPTESVEELRAFLATNGLQPNRALARAASSVDYSLVNQSRAGTLTAEQAALWRHARRLVGRHEAFPAMALGSETAGLDALFEARRAYWGWEPVGRLAVNPAIGKVEPYRDGE